MSTDTTKVCEDCQALNELENRHCWLCRRPFRPAIVAQKLAETQPAKAALERPKARGSQAVVLTAPLTPSSAQQREIVAARQNPWGFSLTMLFVIVTLVALLAGMARDAPGLAISLGFVMALALVATAVRVGRRRGRGVDTTWGQTILTFLVSAAAVIGILFLLAAAAIVALFLYCVWALSKN